MKQSQNRKQMDYVTSLLTGNFMEQKRTIKVDGEIETKITKVFVPRFENKYQPITVLMDLRDELRHDTIVKEGLTPPAVDIDYNVFKKDARDLQLTKKAIKDYKKNLGNSDFLKEKVNFIQQFKDRIPNWGIGSRLVIN